MLKAPFVEKFEDLEITTHNIAFSNTEWEIHPFDSIRGTTFSNIWINHSEYSDNLDGKELTTSLTLIVRNQSDLKNVIICMGTFITRQISINREPERELLILAQYLFRKVYQYRKEQSIKGVDGLDFIIPTFQYSDNHFINTITLK